MAGARMTTRHAPPLRRAGQAPRGHAGVPRGRASGSFLPPLLRARSKCLLSAAWPRGGISSTRSFLQRPHLPSVHSDGGAAGQGVGLCLPACGSGPTLGRRAGRPFARVRRTRPRSRLFSGPVWPLVGVVFLGGPAGPVFPGSPRAFHRWSLVTYALFLHPGGVCLPALKGHGIAIKPRVAS